MGLAEVGRRGQKERLIEVGLRAAALFSVFVTLGIVASLLLETLGFFGHVSLWEFLTSARWAPLFEPQHFGVLPLVSGTLLVACLAASISIPLGLASAIYLSEYASPRTRVWLKPGLEILAGVPSVVYGFFAVFFVTPHLRGLFPDAQVFNALSASIVVGIMTLPTVSSLSDDALRAVPRSLREGAYALGATKLEVSTRVVVPAALSGVMASFILALSRAVGETMAVAMAAGATPKLTLNPLESIQTMTGYIAQVSLGDTPHGSIAFQSLFAVGMTLFLITLAMNLFSNWLVRHYREVYQ
ncbi:MAG: phosphate ABC transporter permease subunit PstC [Halobacteria archaeon]